MRVIILIGLACVLLHEISSASIGNPYQILGVDKKSNLAEIKKAYKQLAKEWLVIRVLRKF